MSHDIRTEKTFTATVEAQHADELRAARDQSDDRILRRYTQHGVPEEIVAYERARDNTRRITWESDAINRAVATVVYETRRAAEVSFDPFGEGEGIRHPAVSLEGVTITVTVRDLVATATLTLAGDGDEPH